MSLSFVRTLLVKRLRESCTGNFSVFANAPDRRYDSTYRAAVFEEPGKPLTIQSKKPSKLKDGEVRIKVQAAAVNASDCLLVQGVNPSGFDLPITPGYEMSGDVVEVKGCEAVAVGDRVVALNKDKLGGFAEECVVHEKDVWLAPSTLDYKKSAALVDSFGSALLGLTRHGHLDEKQIVLATMAPAHGYAALDLAANVYKAKVIAVSMTEEETENLRERGAWSALAYNEKMLLSIVKDLTKSKGVNIIYDTLAGDVLKSCLKCVSHEGHIIIAGYTLKELPQVQMSQLLSLPSFSISGVSLTSYRKHAFDTYRQTVTDVIEMSEQNLISPQISATFSLEDVNKAFQAIKDKQKIGKVILMIKSK